MKIADLHKTRGYSSAIVLSTSREEDVRRCRDAPKGRPRCIMGQKCPHEEQIAVTVNDRNVSRLRENTHF